jgi:hypothetical protein
MHLLGHGLQPAGAGVLPNQLPSRLSGDSGRGSGIPDIRLYVGDPGEWRGPESNWRHHDFQSCALPTELPRREAHRLAFEP